MERRLNDYLLAGVVACLLWGGSAVSTKLSYESLAPMSQGFVRFALASFVFGAILAYRGQLYLPPRRDLGLMALTGILGTTIYFAAENVGISLCPASTSSLVVGSFPAMALAVECLVDQRLPHPAMAAGIALAFVGVVVLATAESSSAESGQLAGIGILMLGGLVWAFYNIIMRAILGRQPVVVITAWQTLFGALGFLPLALFEGAAVVPLSPTTLLSLAFLVLGCTVAAFTLYNHSLKGLSASAASALLNLTPVFGLLLSALILGERIHATQLVGGSVVVAGVALGSYASTGARHNR